jgi:ADP-heptose:LPS heptosyltransferase
LQGSPTILFLRQDRLGDAIITTPLLVALNRQFPQAKLIMLLGENNRGIVPMLPVDCETVIYQKKPKLDSKMLRHLRERHVDILIDLTDNASVTSSLLIRRIKPRIAIGIEKENAVVYDILVSRVNREQFHVSRRVAELLRPFGIDPDSVSLTPVLHLDRAAIVHGRIGMNVSAGASNRYPSASTYAEIARGIAAQPGVTEVRVLSSPEDAGFAESIVELARTPSVLRQERPMTFAEFCKYLTTCEIVVTPDTSIVQVASAAGIPIVGLYKPEPPGVHLWTPTGIPYEMILEPDTLATLEPEPVVALFIKLRERLSTAQTTNTPHV